MLSNETWSLVVSLALGLSNGYFGSVPMISAPSRVRDHQKELTGRPAFRSLQELVFTARCYASAVLAMGLCPCLCLCLSVCLSVCHKSKFYYNG